MISHFFIFSSHWEVERTSVGEAIQKDIQSNAMGECWKFFLEIYARIFALC